jgi:hypothetical protein
MYLPLIQSTGLPDLVSTIRIIPAKLTFAAGEPVEIEVTITNRGSAPAGAFWVDVYLNPSAPPTEANQPWNTRCGMQPCFGLVWEVAGGLAPGQSVVLSSRNLPAGYSVWPGYFASGTSDIYVYADSYDPGVAAGAVAERDEANNRAELHGLSVTGPNPAFVGLQDARELQRRQAPHAK